jgi:hypothetical protein
MTNIIEVVRALIDVSTVDPTTKEKMKSALVSSQGEPRDSTDVKIRRLFDHETHCLEVVKQYKEELKFMYSIQEEVRKERAQFFSTTLREVTQNLASSPIDSKVASQWLQELIRSYTQSLDLSDSLVRTDTFDMIGEIRAKARATALEPSAPSEKSMRTGNE